VNPVGAGDAFVGGYAAAWDRYGNNGELLLSWAAASGTAAALSKRLLYEPEVFRRVLGEQVIATVE
jgi:fructose-1-phosphate kinase PfkB-like protein